MLLLLACVFEVRAEPPPPLASEMHTRFLILATARDAVIEGRFADVGPAIRPLATPDPTAPFPEAWRRMVIRVEGASLALIQAEDIATAAERVATVAVACAECHTETGGGPAVSDPDAPADAWAPGANMPLHQWAVEWMWLGLLADSETAWARGAKELDGKPLTPKFADAPADSDLVKLEQQVYTLARTALTVDTQAERATVMGSLLATCATCHKEHRPVRTP